MLGKAGPDTDGQSCWGAILANPSPSFPAKLLPPFPVSDGSRHQALHTVATWWQAEGEGLLTHFPSADSFCYLSYWQEPILCYLCKLPGIFSVG